MADTKITALAAIATVDPAADVLPIVDISDTSMAASGTTKKVTTNQILQAGGTATLASATITGAATVGTTLGVTGVSTLASATITGALTVDTTTLVVDATNDRVGIGTATPATNLHIINNTAATNSAVDVLTITQSSTGTAAAGLGGGVLFKSERPSGGLILNRGAIYGVSGTDPDDDGDLAFYTLTNTGGSGFTEKVRIDSTGNIVMKIANTGIDFSINSNPAGMTSELLNDYEEGTWSPTPTAPVNLTSVTAVSALYTKVGRLVTLIGSVTATVTSSNTTTYFTLPSLPFANNGTSAGSVQENGNLTVGTSQAASSNLYCFFPAASAIVSGAATFYYSITYTV